MDKNKEKKKKKVKEGNFKQMKKGLDILDNLNAISKENDNLKVVKLDGNISSVVFFTNEYRECFLHYTNYDDLRGYSLCNEDIGDCILCQAGKERVKKYLIPVFSVESGIVELLPVSPSVRPLALLPQISNIIINKKCKKIVAYISRQDGKYQVSTGYLDKEVRSEVLHTIRQFIEDWDSGELDFGSVYRRVDNDTLSGIPEIERLLKAKGIKLKKEDDSEDV
jgi:hypothetical protein